MLIAYIDPGLGMLIWQTVVAAFVGAFFYLNKTRRWVVGLFLKIFRGFKNDAASANEIPDAEKAQAETKVKIDRV